MLTGMSWHKVGSGLEHVAVPIVLGSLKEIVRIHIVSWDRENLRRWNGLIRDWIIYECSSVAGESCDKCILSTFEVADLVHCNRVLALANSIVLNYSSIAAIALWRAVSCVYALSGEISYLVFVALVVNYLLAVREAVLISCSAISGSEPANTYTLADWSKVTTVESNTATCWWANFRNGWTHALGTLGLGNIVSESINWAG